MSIVQAQSDFESDLGLWLLVYEELATRRSFTASSDFTLEDECLLEGMLSRIWQSWCKFCRTLFIQSCLGTSTPSQPILALPQAVSEQSVSQAVIHAKKGKHPYWQGVNSVLRYEPTWGDCDVLLDVVNKLSPANATNLKDVCVIGDPGAGILQTIRNAAAHNNVETSLALQRKSAAYFTFPIAHPVQALFWVDSASSDHLIVAAVEALRAASVQAVL